MNNSQFREAFMESANHEFDIWCKEYSKIAQDFTLKSNTRILKVFAYIKGEQFSNDLKQLSKIAGDGLIKLAKSPKGMKIKDKRWSTIPEIWVNQKATSEGIQGEIFVQISTNKWAYVSFYNNA